MDKIKGEVLVKRTYCRPVVKPMKYILCVCLKSHIVSLASLGRIEGTKAEDLFWPCRNN